MLVSNSSENGMAEPKRRKPPGVRRQEILQAIIAVGSERGLDTITARDVAAQAGVTPGLIHHYFPSMDALIAEAFGEWADGRLAAVAAQEGTASPLEALALLVVNVGPEQRLWYDALIASSRFELLRHRAKQLSESYHADVTGLIRAGVEAGLFHCSEPEAAAWRIILMLDGLVPMVYIMQLIEPQQIPGIAGPFIERELGLAERSLTPLIHVGVTVNPDGWRLP